MVRTHRPWRWRQTRFNRPRSPPAQYTDKFIKRTPLKSKNVHLPKRQEIMNRSRQNTKATWNFTFSRKGDSNISRSSRKGIRHYSKIQTVSATSRTKPKKKKRKKPKDSKLRIENITNRKTQARNRMKIPWVTIWNKSFSRSIPELVRCYKRACDNMAVDS